MIPVLVKIGLAEKYKLFKGTARTARFSKKSPWSVFFRGEMS
jgi:hypothetical protein